MARFSEVPTTQRAVVSKGPGATSIDESAPMPVPENNEILIKVMSVAVNPVDGKTVVFSPTPGAVSGCDFAGIVVGPAGPKARRQWPQGSRVLGWIMGANPARLANGSFAQYLAAKADLLMRIPDSMAFETAATYGMSVSTGGLALFKHLGLSFTKRRVTPSSPSVLVYGGSTSSGAMAIQLLRAAGYRALAVCSPGNFGMVKKLGAVEAFDYHDPSCGKQIRSYTFNQLHYALDCISTTESIGICYSALSSDANATGLHYLSLDPFPVRIAQQRPEVMAEWILTFTMLGDVVALEGMFRREPSTDDFEFGVTWHRTAESLLEEGLVKPHPAKLVPGGLAGVRDAMQTLTKGKVSAVKQVCVIEEQT